MRQQIDSIVAGEQPQMVAFRRTIHQRPELSFHEERTASAICGVLQASGIPYTRKGRRGIAARLTGTRPGPHIAFRADFDALAIQEETDLPYASTEPGVMHACGHDAHTAVLLSFAKTIAAHPALIHGTVTFLFQDAEEIPPGGAKAMVEDGCLDGVDKIYAFHVADDLDAGVVGVCEGMYMAASDSYEVIFSGKGGHASRPNEGEDTILTMATAICTIDSIPARFLPVQAAAVVTTCAVNGGSSYNVIPEKCKILGTVRTFDKETAEKIRDSIESCVKSACLLYRTSYEYSYHWGYPALSNDAAHCQVVRDAARIARFPCVKIHPTTIAEDFSFYLQRIPGAYFRVGIRNPEKNAVYPLHSGKFQIDEDAMTAALKMFWMIYLRETGQG